MNNNYKQQGSFKDLLKKSISLLVFILVMAPMMLMAQEYCQPQVSPVGANSPTEPISLVKFGTGPNAINNASSAEVSVDLPKYEDFTGISMNVEKGSTYTLVVKGNTDGDSTNYITVYIDWNQDGTFSNSLSQNEKYQYTPALINSNGLDDVEMVYDITIPADALNGQTRMRVVKNYQAPSPNPCYPVATFGQAEDYTLNVADGVSNQPCAPVTDLYENFDNYSCCNMGVVPTCWDSIILGGASQIISSTQPASGTSQIYQTGYGAGKVSIVVLPQFSNVNEGTHRFRFKVKANSGPGQLDFGYITDITDATTFVVLESLTITNNSYNSTEAERIFTVPTTVPANARLAIRNPGTTWAGMYWDDVYWEPLIVGSVEITTQGNVPATITTDSGTLNLVATVIPEGQPVTWSITAGSGLGVVDSTGFLFATGNGTITVRAALVSNPLIYDEIDIVVTGQVIEVTAIEVSTENNVPAVITTDQGTLQLEAEVTPFYATDTDVVWTVTAGGEFASVDENGLVTATANGTVTVKATSVQDPEIYDEIEISVSNQFVAVVSLEISIENDAEPLITTDNGTLQLIVAVMPDDATNNGVVWSITQGSEFATINANGLVTATANGTVIVRATSEDNNALFDEIEVTISNQNIAVIAIEVNVENNAEPVITVQNGTLQLVAVITPDDATNTGVVWSITAGEEFASVNENGLVTATANGIVTVRATSADNETIYDEIEITINVPTNGIGEYDYNAFTIYPNPVTDILTISSSQVVKQAEVYNMMGQIVYSAQQDTLNLSSVQQGVYVIQVQFENGAIATQKLIKK